MTPYIQWWGEIVPIPPDSWVFCVWFWKDSQSMIIIGSRERERERENDPDWIMTRLVWWAGHLSSRETMVHEHDMTHYSSMGICISQSPSSNCSRWFFVNWIFKGVIWFSTLREEVSENRLVFSDYLCPRKRRCSMKRFKRTGHSIASVKITLLLLQRRLSDDA